jgi:uncharacterized Fe-S cluster protein YjdI
MKDITKKYSNGEVTVVWKPTECIHSGICFRGLGEVFNPQKRPWITLENSATENIIAQVKKCPSGALSYYVNREIEPEELNDAKTVTTIEAIENGPLMVYGNIRIKAADGNVSDKNDKTALCRCGGSKNKPFCDGTHKKNGFNA